MTKIVSGTFTRFNKRIVGNYNAADFRSKDIIQLKKFINNLPQNAFDYAMVPDNDNFMRISLKLYGDMNFWDVLIAINGRDSLAGLPFDFDTIDVISNDKIIEYETFVYGKTVPEPQRTELLNLKKTELDVLNEGHRVIKYIKPDVLGQFIQTAYDNNML